MSESNEQTYEETAQKGLAQDLEPAEVIQGLIAQEESSISEPEQKSVIKPVDLEAIQEPVESVLQDPEIVGVGEPMTEESQSEESLYTDTQMENESGRGAAEMNKGVKEVEEGAGEPGQGFIEDKGKIVEEEVTIGEKVEIPQKEESVERQEGDTKSEKISEEEWQAVTAQMGTDGGLPDMDEVRQEEEKQEAAKTEESVIESVIEVEARREEVEAESEALLQKVSREEEVLPTDKTVPEKTQQEPEVTVDTKGAITLQEPVITKSKATGGKTHEASDVNEIITSRDPNENDQGEPVLMNTIEELPPTPILKLRLGDTDAPMEEHVESTQTKAIGQEAWKIGAIAAAFFLILQTAVTVVYILKCRRKPNSGVAPKNLCAGGNGGIECDANNTDTTIPIDEQTTVDDLPEYSQVQQEDVAMTTVPLDSTEKNSSYDPRTSAV
ncbi:sodium/potassium/calcium exchanger 1 isoform X2 [Megalobrama amblycephala]|uniref:sodium/potassium/calcium exchanger 1 isoform X2 n=1 Tax=Megalobrama amblycephala TaxID=75352 RepID=UPI002013CC9D|nr:sodium/potassium/calcium exchanger 1 isoform X2 [Megalobrama amblycephala]